MAKVKALTSFAGIISMSVGEVAEIEDNAILKDLKAAGYVEVLEKEEQTVEKDEKKAKSSKKKGDA